MSYGHHVFDDLLLIVHDKEEKIMKKNLLTVVLAVALLGGVTVYVATPQTPERYIIHTVQHGETMESIIRDSNHNATVDYDIRDAVSVAVSKSKGLDNGATSRQLNIGDKVAVPIYR